MLAILEYGAGNQTSVLRALEHLDIPCKITSNPQEIAACDGLIFPGVGAAAQAMARLEADQLDATMRDAVRNGQPLLGICLGCQILLDRSEEGPTSTLGLIAGQCRRFPADLREDDGTPAKIPHMGWNGIEIRQQSPILRDIGPQSEFYFVHSYYVEPDPALVLATSRHGLEFCAIYGRDGLWGVQFHPEKSGAPGLAILANFNNYCRGKKKAWCPNV